MQHTAEEFNAAGQAVKGAADKVADTTHRQVFDGAVALAIFWKIKQ